MKKISIFMILVAMFLLFILITAVTSDAAQQGEWEWASKKTYKYMLVSREFDVRVVEWTPKDNPNIRCMVVLGSEKRFGTVCYPVERKKEK